MYLVLIFRPGFHFTIVYVSTMYINAKADDLSAVVTLLCLSFVKNLEFTGLIPYRVLVNWIHIGLLKAGFAWKVISTRFLIEHTEFVTRRCG